MIEGKVCSYEKLGDILNLNKTCYMSMLSISLIRYES
jgi:hypothetical protein